MLHPPALDASGKGQRLSSWKVFFVSFWYRRRACRDDSEWEWRQDGEQVGVSGGWMSGWLDK